MYFGKPTSSSLLVFAALSFVISAFAVYSWATYTGLPGIGELRSASGRVAQVENGRYGIRFSLEGVPENFNYASRGGAVGIVHGALTSADRQMVKVQFDPQRTVGALGTSEKYYEVYQLAANGKIIRSRAEVERAWSSDMRLALWLGIFFVLNGAFLARRAWRMSGAA